jgi:hypothetical protein
MRTKLVTSYYAYHNGEPYWGQSGRDRWYKYSLACICGMGVDIVCYTDPGDLGYNQLVELKEKFQLDNLTIKIYDISTNPYQDRVYKIRMADEKRYNDSMNLHHYIRSPQIYWMKYHFLEMENEPDINLYWIDAGLSHTGLFPPSASKYYEVEGYEDYYKDSPEGFSPHEHEYYWFDKAFNPSTIERINDFADGKIVNLYRYGTTDNNFYEFNEKIEEQLDYELVFVVAGFFGGNSNVMTQYLIDSKELVEKCLSTGDYICTEQEIMTYLNAKDRGKFANFKFDTFYHEGWSNIYQPSMKPFSYFFIKDLK